jgi:wyosine [tRNA(Phe)-imidazoG37] synthetase (radical SAM superfamily)
MTVPIAFGPVPSRRLGRSLGINNVPPKVCSYSCVYCQVGATPAPQLQPRPMYPTEQVVAAVTELLDRVRARGEPVDYLTFVPDGEPTIDSRLGETIAVLRRLGVPIAVISNGSLAWRPEVRDVLRSADWVSVKVDAVDEPTWRRINRPHADLELATVLDGIRALAADFPGRLVSETMFVAGINDGEASVAAIAGFLAEIGIDTAYLAIPTRPPAEPDVAIPDAMTLVRAYEQFAERLGHVEQLIGYEGDDFASSGDARTDLLGITAVHPMRATAVTDLLARDDADWSLVDELVTARQLVAVDYRGDRYYTRPAAVASWGNRPCDGGPRDPGGSPEPGVDRG